MLRLMLSYASAHVYLAQLDSRAGQRVPADDSVAAFLEGKAAPKNSFN
jgi:hypothetical protein